MAQLQKIPLRSPVGGERECIFPTVFDNSNTMKETSKELCSYDNYHWLSVLSLNPTKEVLEEDPTFQYLYNPLNFRWKRHRYWKLRFCVAVSPEAFCVSGTHVPLRSEAGRRKDL